MAEGGIDVSGLMQELIKHKIVIIYRGYTAQLCLEMSKALMDAGVRFFEVTMNTAEAVSAIRQLHERLGNEAHIGAGTVTSVQQVEEAAEAGARYIISPNTNQAVIRRTKELGLLSIPGAFTASEVATAWETGADIVKIFPINVVGAEYIRQLRGPLDHIPYMPSGGITLDQVEGLFQAGSTAVGVGAQLLGKALIDAKDWEGLRASAGRFLAAAGFKQEG
jgi:2-dehydro-3-deoxyphosphogluconate aldolase/(4S)-4-hydroxy-2-oxoglutarate aldolase